MNIVENIVAKGEIPVAHFVTMISKKLSESAYMQEKVKPMIAWQRLFIISIEPRRKKTDLPVLELMGKFNAFPHTTILQHTTLKTVRQKHEKAL